MKPTLRRLGLDTAVAIAFVAALAGCSTLEAAPQATPAAATKSAQTASPYPSSSTPFRTITGFTPALRCMDNLMVDYGVRDLSTLVEDVVDQTKKVNAGTRDMLISAVSDMTRRSRAVRVVAFGRDTTNAITFLASAQRQGAYETLPQFDIKGSVSQFDENVIRNQKDGGIGFEPFIHLGVSSDSATSVLGLDLSVLTTRDMSLLSGVTSRNSVVILKSGKGLDGDAAYHKFGLSFTMSLSKSEGQSQALRGLVELAVVELMGKLTKTPYWTCLGADANANDEISQEMSDWYFSMASNRKELIGYFQNQLRRRGFYQGPIDGAFNPAVDEAIGNYRAALGMSNKAVLDELFFKAYLAADHSKIPAPAKPAVYVAVADASTNNGAPQAAPVANNAPMALALSTANHQTRFASGEAVSLMLQPSRDAHVYCYLQDESAKIVRFYPNRFSNDSLVPASAPLSLPGKLRFQLVMNAKGTPETIACFATPSDVIANLPKAIVGVDFEPLDVASLDQINTAFVGASGGAVVHEVFRVLAK